MPARSKVSTRLQAALIAHDKGGHGSVFCCAHSVFDLECRAQCLTHNPWPDNVCAIQGSNDALHDRVHVIYSPVWENQTLCFQLTVKLNSLKYLTLINKCKYLAAPLKSSNRTEDLQSKFYHRQEHVNDPDFLSLGKDFECRPLLFLLWICNQTHRSLTREQHRILILHFQVEIFSKCLYYKCIQSSLFSSGIIVPMHFSQSRLKRISFKNTRSFIDIFFN